MMLAIVEDNRINAAMVESMLRRLGCGYCTAGWLIAGADLLRRHPHPTDADIDTLPNLCRCGCQSRVRKAIQRVGEAKGAQA